ncbi:MAG: TOBE domain-containing protein [Proteobacteria bacterium]|jgi:molybdate transport system regulatory protein|nr:tyrosine-type recombinase/integrase [Desulfocapsa sp.]MBU3945672.1 TOBE domain-containing protein [Pseudomonadota bacterium]MCG2743617.1 TOBE domain-containing protein [Desulfobacteraceae bacterium]MBU3984430.1 TOBE domain-containing protein [Pseudomonadota bacterium]MBU4030278.1 TOBE domain-containing protein [Pseudomonadota bacterium]
MKPPVKSKKIRQDSRTSLSVGNGHGRIVSIADGDECLDTTQLNQVDQSFRDWADHSRRIDVRFSRQRILLIFLLIRYTGAKLSEVLALNPLEDIDWIRHVVVFRGSAVGANSEQREVQISETLSREIQDQISDPQFREYSKAILDLDPGFVRRKFYERAQDCGFPKQLGGPETIRKARAVELIQSNMPLPAVQMILGHSTPNLTSSHVSFSKDEIQIIAKRFMEKESLRKTSARNSFFAKIQTIIRGDIQTRVDLTTIEGHSITTVITNGSLERLGLSQGRLITAEVKAPWVILQGGETEPACSAENRFKGVATKITRGKINTECVVRISDTTEICAVVSTAGSWLLDLSEGDNIWVLFNCFSVVLHVD